MRSYRDLLRVPRMARLLSATVLARMPIGINGLAIVLFLRAETGSFAIAGVVAGSLALGAGVGAPVAARLVDRFGPRVLLALAALHGGGLVALLALGSAGAPTPALVAAGALAGLALPPVSSVLRALYPRLLGGSDGLVKTAFALDSVLTETLFILGPLLVAALVAVADAGVALLVSAGAVLAGTALFVAALPGPAPVDADAEVVPRAGLLGALASPGIRTLVLAMLPVGFAFGALEVALPAFADAEGRPELAGVLLAIWSLGSAAGGLAYGAMPRRIPLEVTHLRVALLLPLGLLLMAAATEPALMAVLVIPAGVLIAPLLATRNELAGAIAPRGAETEALTWPLTALVSGLAVGAAAAGVIIDASDWRAAVLTGAGVAAIGGAISLARRGTLTPATG